MTVFPNVGPISAYKLANQPAVKSRIAEAMHLEPGVVRYEGKGEGGGDLMLMLPKDTIDRMRDKFKGSPVVNETHRDMSPGEKGDGQVLRSYWNGDLGQEIVEYEVWTQEAVDNLESGKYGVSCSYTVTEHDKTPGTWHNVHYDGTILDGEYNHLAIVPNPRYEDSRNTLLNAKGGEGMFKLLLKKLGIENSVEVDGAKSHIEHGGKKILLKDAVAMFEAANAAPEVLEDDVIVTLANGKKVTVADIKKALKNEAPGVTAGTKADPPTGAMNADDVDKKKKDDEEKAKNAKDEQDKKDKEKAENEAKDEKDKKEKAENARLENDRKAAASVAAEKAKALDDAARLRNNSYDNSERPYVTEADALARGRSMFGSDVAAR
jgi:hypothetical protein